MKYAFLLLLIPLSVSSAFAQKGMEGLWDGKIFVGGINSEQFIRFQLFLEVEGDRITGKSVVYPKNSQIVEMKIFGYMYGDRSVYMEETEFLPLEEDQLPPAYRRKFQFIFKRSTWESTLEGFWQQVIRSPMDKKRARGKIFLKRMKDKA